MRKSTILGLTAGLVLSAGIVYAAQNVAAQAEESSYVLSIDPKDGSVVSDLSTVTITFKGRMGVNDQMTPAVAVLENTTTGETWFCHEPDNNLFDGEGNQSYTFVFTEFMSNVPVTVNTPGNYTLTLKGFYTSETEDANGMMEYDFIAPLVYHYTINNFPVEYTLSPAAGSQVKDLTRISLTFPNTLVSYYDQTRPAIATLENVETGDAWYCVEPNLELLNEPGQEPGIVYNFTFYEVGSDEVANITNPGTYRLTVKGLFVGEEEKPEDLPVLYATYTIAYPVAYTLDPAPGVSSVLDLSKVTLTFGQNLVAYYDNMRPAFAIIENTTTGDTYYCYEPQAEYVMEGKNEGIEYYLSFYEAGSEEVAVINQPGQYVLTIRGLYTGTLDAQGELTDTQDLPVIVANYTIDYPVAYTVNPEEGIVEDLSEVTLTFTEGSLVGFYDVHPAVAILENTTTGDQYYAETATKDPRATQPTYTFKFTELGGSEEEIINVPGSYVLTIRGAYQSIIDENGNSTDIDLPVITLKYTIAYPVSYTLTPAEGSEVEELSKVTLTFPANLVAYYDNMRPALAVLENTTTGDQYFCYEPQAEYLMEEGEEGIEYYLSFYEAGSEEVAVINEVGNYVLTVRGLYTGTLDAEGELTDTQDLPAIVANYTIPYPVKYELTPAADAKVENLSKVTLTFPENLVAYYDNVRPALAVLENNTTGDQYFCYEPQVEYLMENGEEGIEYYLSFYEAGEEEVAVINQPGSYTLSVRGLYTGTLDAEGELADTQDLPVIVANYTIDYPVAYTLNPEDGAMVETLSEITVTFEAGVNVGIGEFRPAPGVLENTTSGDVFYCESPLFAGRDEDGSMSYIFTFTDLGSTDELNITEPGEYVFTVNGLYTTTIDENGEESEPTYLPSIVATYTISYPVVYELTPANGTEVEELSEVVLTFPNDALIGINSEVRPAAVILENITTSETYVCENPAKSYNEDGGAVFTITFSSLGSSETVTVKEEGEYVLTVKGLFSSVLDGDNQVDTDLPNIIARFYITSGAGVEGIFTDETNFNVYGINGVQVVRNGSVDALRSLRPGLYIINGKKVFIK